jgi:hypothetical protein
MDAKSSPAGMVVGSPPEGRPPPLRRLAAWLQREWPGLAGIAVLIGLLLILRGDALLSTASFNPDEAEFLAEAKRVGLSWIPYATSTETTHFYLLPWTLAMLGRLGLSLGLPLAHLLAGLVYLFLGSVTWWCLHRRVGIWFGGLGVAGPIVVLFAARDHADFLSFSSELVPVVFMAAGVAVAFAPRRPPGPVRVAVASMLLGLAPLGKLQALPLALVLCAGVVVYVQRQQTGRPAGTGRAFTIAATRGLGWFLLPTILFVTLLVVTGKLTQFIGEPIAFQIDYALRRGVIQPGGDLGWQARLTGLSSLIAPAQAVSSVILAAGTVSLGSILLRPWSWRRRRALLGITLLCAAVLAGLLGAIAPFPYFPHYSVLLFAGAMLGSVVSSAVMTDAQSPAPRMPSTRRAHASSPLLVVLAAACIIPLAPLILRAPTWPTGWSSLIASNEADVARSTHPSDTKLLTLCPPKSRVFVWGWANELYSNFAWTPASRYVNSIWQIFPLQRQTAYRANLASELVNEPPQCIINAVGPGFFGGIPTEMTVQATIPGVQLLLAKCYQPSSVPGPNGSTLSLFVRRAECAGRSVTP